MNLRIHVVMQTRVHLALDLFRDIVRVMASPIVVGLAMRGGRLNDSLSSVFYCRLNSLQFHFYSAPIKEEEEEDARRGECLVLSALLVAAEEEEKRNF